MLKTFTALFLVVFSFTTFSPVPSLKTLVKAIKSHEILARKPVNTIYTKEIITYLENLLNTINNIRRHLQETTLLTSIDINVLMQCYSDSLEIRNKLNRLSSYAERKKLAPSLYTLQKHQQVILKSNQRVA
jgi:hypothetical protein